VRTYVAVTDADWYRFLAAQPGLTEVNFWRPRDTREFRAIGAGEPFFFKTHAPHNRIVGGGFYSSSANLRLSEAWEWFGTANGVASLAEMRIRILLKQPGLSGRGQYGLDGLPGPDEPDVGLAGQGLI